MPPGVGIDTNLNLSFMLSTNKDSNWAAGVDGKCETRKRLIDNVGESLQELGLGWGKVLSTAPEA